MILLLMSAVLSVAVGQNEEKIDSLKRALKRVDGKGVYEIEFDLFVEYRDHDYDEALDHITKAINLARDLGDSLAIVQSANAQGFLLGTYGHPSDAIKIFEYGLKIARLKHYDKMTIFILNNLALSYTLKADYDRALEYNFESLKIREAEGDKEMISVAYNNIGLVYHEMQDFENALVFYEKCYQLKIDMKLKRDLDRTLINIGIVLNELGRYDQGEARLKEVFALCESEECSKEIMAEANQLLGRSLLSEGKFQQAELCFLKSLTLSQQLSSPNYISEALFFLAKLKYQEKKYQEAIGYLDQSQLVAKRASFNRQILSNYEYYSLVYSALNDFKKASEYKGQYIKLNSEIFSADLIKNISRVQSEYQEQENLKTIAEKDQILLLNEEVITQKTFLNWLLTSVIALTAVLGFVIYRNYKKIKDVIQALASAKRIIEVQNRLLDKQVQEKTKELVDTNETLVKVNDELDNFIYKTSHDIRGPLASLKGMVNLAMMDVKDEKALGYLSKLDLTAEKLNVVLTRLLIVNRINHAELTPEAVHFESIIQEIFTLEMKKGVPSKIKIEFDVDPGIELISDREMIRVVLENLIDNAFKFYNDSLRVESFVKIAVRSDNGRVSARVMDNGVGISQMNREKIFQMFVRASERSETGGIGLYLAKLATEKLGGEINLVSTDEKYTEFIVEFPNNLQSIIDKRKEERSKFQQERMQLGKIRASQPPDLII
ncbi:hypothetical protein BH09BAC3_BH09BAC3_07840 [soil metagenome]